MKEYTWLSAHIYYSGDADHLLKELILPYLNELRIHLKTNFDFFFIRYHEDGFHIRLRIRILSTEVTGSTHLLENNIKHLQQHKKLATESLTVKYNTYQTEIERYGGEPLISWAEKQFNASSAMALTSIAERKIMDSSYRYIVAIKMHLAMFYAMELDKREASQLCMLFITQWLPRLYNNKNPPPQEYAFFINLFKKTALQYQPILSAVIPEYKKSLITRPVKASVKSYIAKNKMVIRAYEKSGIERQKLLSILASFMHMTNNRVGVSNRDEAFIVFLVKYCLNYFYG